MSDTALPSRSGVTIRRGAAVGEDWGTLDLRIEDATDMTLPPEGVRTVFMWPGSAQLDILQDGQLVYGQTLPLPADTKIDYDLDLAPQGLLSRLLRHPPKLRLQERSRAHLAPYDPGPVRMLTHQIWLGTAEEDEFIDLMSERDEYYSEENEEAEGTDAHIALSGFAEAMGEEGYDGDFVEYSWCNEGGALEERFKGHSFVDQWMPIAREMLADTEFAAANAFIMVGVEAQEQGSHLQIKAPRDLDQDGVALRYLGEITHPSH